MLWQGPTFQRLSAEEKRTAADKAAKMKPVLKRELEKLMRCPEPPTSDPRPQA